MRYAFASDMSRAEVSASRSDPRVMVAAGAAVTVGIVAAVLLIILVFLIGRRRGAASRTVVEIRRV